LVDNLSVALSIFFLFTKNLIYKLFCQKLSADKKAKKIFDALSPSSKKAYLRWTGSAKREETRQARAASAIEKLLSGKKVPV
tara:strand:- start:4821 stop:5066 length:246 start_codon:yes stop_codon:yes gene_type:complete